MSWCFNFSDSHEGARRCDTQRLNPAYDAILFDFDGVLVDSEPLHYAAWMEALAPFGISTDWETYRRTWVGVSDWAMIERLAALQSPPLAFEEVWSSYPRKRDLFNARMAVEPIFPPATLALIASLADLPLAVVSSSNRTEVEPPLVRAGIRDHFATLVCGLEAPRLKPDPAPYLLAAERLGVRRPLVVEDSIAGRQAGEAAGFEVLFIREPGEVAEQVRARLAR